MKEIITKIDTNFTENRDSWSGYDGVLIETTKQEVKLLISNGQDCCENWGYLHTNDNVEEFIGAEVLDIFLTDDGLYTSEMKEQLDDEYCELNLMFCTVKTDRGDFQFTAYNSHNGYYGHEVKIISNQLNVTDGV